MFVVLIRDMEHFKVDRKISNTNYECFTLFCDLLMFFFRAKSYKNNSNLTNSVLFSNILFFEKNCIFIHAKFTKYTKFCIRANWKVKSSKAPNRNTYLGVVIYFYSNYARCDKWFFNFFYVLYKYICIYMCSNFEKMVSHIITHRSP